MPPPLRSRLPRSSVIFLLAAAVAAAQPSNQWTELAKDTSGARRGSPIRYAYQSGAFFLWGFLNDDPDAPQEIPTLKIPEYHMVFFDPSTSNVTCPLGSGMLGRTGIPRNPASVRSLD